MDRSKAPCTVNSFVSLADQHFYDKTDCHRLGRHRHLRVAVRRSRPVPGTADRAISSPTRPTAPRSTGAEWWPWPTPVPTRTARSSALLGRLEQSRRQARVHDLRRDGQRLHATWWPPWPARARERRRTGRSETGRDHLRVAGLSGVAVTELAGCHQQRQQDRELQVRVVGGQGAVERPAREVVAAGRARPGRRRARQADQPGPPSAQPRHARVEGRGGIRREPGQEADPDHVVHGLHEGEHRPGTAARSAVGRFGRRGCRRSPGCRPRRIGPPRPARLISSGPPNRPDRQRQDDDPQHLGEPEAQPLRGAGESAAPSPRGRSAAPGCAGGSRTTKW